jgi:hypothetical protein
MITCPLWNISNYSAGKDTPFVELEGSTAPARKYTN